MYQREKIIGTSDFCSSVHISDRDDIVDLYVNYEQLQTKDVKLKDQANSLIYNKPSETKTFPVTDETKNDIKNVNI